MWNSIIGGIKTQVSASAFKTWFSGACVLNYQRDGALGQLTIAVKNSFQKEQVERRYLPLIKRVAQERGAGDLEVALVVARGETAGEDFAEPLFSGIAPTTLPPRRRADSLMPAMTFVNFVVGVSNNLAVLAFEQVCGNFGSLYNPLLVWGPTGVGKTHLLHALGNDVAIKIPQARILYASAEKFTNDYISALKNRSMADFRQRYRGVDLLLMDDVQFLAGKESTQDEFFNTFNELALSARQIVLACDRHPKNLARLQDRIVGRLLGGMVVNVGLPDVELREAILSAKCQERGVALSGETIDYIAANCQGGARELEGVLAQLILLAKMNGGRVGDDDVARALSRIDATRDVVVEPDAVFAAVCKFFKIKKEALVGGRRRADLAFARQVLMFLLRNDVGLSLVGVGQMVGGRDHSTVIHSVDKVEELISQKNNIRDVVERIRMLFHKS